MHIEKLKRQIKSDEGFRQFPYRDIVGKLTIGYGFNLDDVGLSEHESEHILSLRIAQIMNRLRVYSWFNLLCPDRKNVVINMSYQMGVSGMLKFKKMIKGIIENDFEKASNEMLDSKWAKQTPHRAKRLADIMRTGIDES
jgi:lysozyme